MNSVMTNSPSFFYKLFFSSIIIAGSMVSVYSQVNPGGSYLLRINYIDKDSSFSYQGLGLQTSFVNQPQCADYIKKIPSILALKGYPAASVDSVIYDSSFAEISLYLGIQHLLVKLNTNVEKKVLELSGFHEKDFTGKPLNIAQLELLKDRVLNYYEKNGYPFAAVFLDSIQLTQG
ncbi:MAG: hypothetical protein ABIN67_12190, partial [Ferruginibacter sp.]